MDFINKILENDTVKKNLLILVLLMVLFGITFVFNNRYNRGGSKANLWIARIAAVIGCILVIAWLFI